VVQLQLFNIVVFFIFQHSKVYKKIHQYQIKYNFIIHTNSIILISSSTCSDLWFL